MKALAVALLAVTGAAVAAPPADLDAYVARAMSAFEAPGMAIAIVEDGRTTLAKGYGIRKMGEATPVDEHSLFPMASNTKQFTATALAMLVDEGKLSWDDKVVSRLPGFQMYDAYVTGEMTVTDLLTHRSGLGLGEGDLMLVNTDFTGKEIVEHLRYLKPARGFRAGYAYDNVLYIAAGQLVEAVAHQRWEDFIRGRIFAPLGMKDSTPSFEFKRGANRAWQHGRRDGPIFGVGHIAPLVPAPPVNAAANPAGGINSSAADMAKWLTAQLAHGALPGGKRLFSEAQSAALWNPETLIPVPPAGGPLAATEPQFQSYALGFEVADYRGHKIVTHGGGWFGGLSTTVMIPDRHVGFAVMINSEERGALRSVEMALLDHYLDLPATDWTPIVRDVRKSRIDKAVAVMTAKAAVDAGSGPPPSLPLDQYAGVYRDPWYGTVTIRRNAEGNGLSIGLDRTQGMTGPLEPVRYDTFRTRWRDRSLEDAYVTFMLKPDGSIDHARMQAISPLADFSFDYQDLLLTPEPAKH